MNINKITEQILTHKDGITLDFEGNIPELKGFAVSVTNNTPRIDIEEIKGDIIKLIELSNTLEIKAYIGSWIDGDNKTFVDLTLNVQDKTQAENIGRMFKQQAIFNFDTFEVISL